MIPKKYNYVEIDGNHWPDADKGDNLFYSLDFSCWLNGEEDSFVSAEWTLPDGVTSDESFIGVDEAVIKIHTPSIGSYKVICTLTSNDRGREQTNVIPMVLKVY